MKRAGAVLLGIFIAVQRLYAPVVGPLAQFDKVTVSGNSVILRGHVNVTGFTWELIQSPALNPPNWTITSQQPVYVSTNFSCTNTLPGARMFYRLRFGG